MNILILPAAETLLTKEEIDWIHKSIPGNEKVIADAIEFAVNHPETFVGILIGGFDNEKNIDYVIEITEIDPEDMDYWQMRGEISPTNYTADIVRRQKTAIEKEEEDDEDNLSERRLLVGRVYL
ncbi:MAG: hypothetical protein M3297_02960 [Thermoproteota archaeon]|jgi:hypothetical protein|nr:hypothetical protein [Thermoproteota archaeon]